MQSWKRLLALLLCLALLPCGALADGVQFSLSMTAAEPADSTMHGGLADLLNIVALEGTLATDPDDGCYDLNVELLMDRDERTRTAVRLYGTGGNHAWMNSSLLGDQTLMFNMLALQEFAIKMYHHMALPLQYMTILVPFSTTDVLSRIGEDWNPVTHATSQTRTVSADALADMFDELAEHMQSVTQLYYYIEALAADSGYDDMLLTVFDEMSDWVRTNFADQELLIAIDEQGTETWTMGDTLMATLADQHGEVCLTDLPDDCQLSWTWDNRSDSAAVQFELNLIQDDECLLHFALSASGLPESLTADAVFSADLELTGLVVALHETRLHAEGEIAGGQLSARITADKLLDDLTITGTLSPWTSAETPHFAPENVQGLNFFSLADTSLTEFVSSIKEPLIRGTLPLAVHAPVSTCVTLMDILTQGGIFDLLSSGAPTPSASNDDDEDWDDEDGDWDSDEDDEDWDNYGYPYSDDDEDFDNYGYPYSDDDDEEFDNYGYPYFDDDDVEEDDSAY